MRKIVLICLMFVAVSAQAQQIDLQSLDKLAAKASEKTQVDLNEALLKLGAAFLSDKNPEESAGKKVIDGLKAVYVRTFQFEKEGAYSIADLQPIRDQLKAPQWNRVVSVDEGKELTEVWMYRMGEDSGGMLILAAEPNELTVVNIVGTLNAADLAALAGQFGIPKLGIPKK